MEFTFCVYKKLQTVKANVKKCKTIEKTPLLSIGQFLTNEQIFWSILSEIIHSFSDRIDFKNWLIRIYYARINGAMK